MQDGEERNGTKWLKQVISTRAWDDFARETGQQAVAPPEFPADGRALICNIIVIHVADDISGSIFKGISLQLDQNTPQHRGVPLECLFIFRS